MMKTELQLVATALVICMAATGCANNRELISLASPAARSDVFAEIANPDAQPEKATADISLTIKSNLSRFAGIYNKHSAPPYHVHLDIDGQAVVLEADPVLEDKSPIDPAVPDSGIGWKYKFSTRIALTPGKHSLTIALPVDGVIVKRELELRAGLNIVEVLPVYGKRLLRPYKGQNFTAGVNTLEITVR